jgi:hypothetical protein
MRVRGTRREEAVQVVKECLHPAVADGGHMNISNRAANCKKKMATGVGRFSSEDFEPTHASQLRGVV